MSGPQTHDYTVRKWGHDYTFDPLDEGQRGRMIGWGRGLLNGDYLLLENPESGHPTRYRIKAVTYFHNPGDMWRADVVFAPRHT
jgi:hypothetical protein